MGIPFSRWGAQPFVSAPIPFPVDLVARYASASATESDAPATKPNALTLAQTWSTELAQNPSLTKAKIARREGLTRARITQIMGLLQLALEIQAVLHNMRMFPEREIRPLLQCPDTAAQLRRWRILAKAAGW